MVVRRLQIALLVIGLAPALASCAGFSGYVADHWPHWAGGMPEGVPPRPGAPGYDDYIAHQERHGQDTTGTVKSAVASTPGASQAGATAPPVTPSAPAARAATAAPVAEARPAVETSHDDPALVRGGGLY
jgi:hypothetical protein